MQNYYGVLSLQYCTHVIDFHIFNWDWASTPLSEEKEAITIKLSRIGHVRK